jgi:hypothetical protein
VYSHLRPYINPKTHMGMPVTGHHVWGHVRAWQLSWRVVLWHTVS